MAISEGDSMYGDDVNAATYKSYQNSAMGWTRHDVPSQNNRNRELKGVLRTQRMLASLTGSRNTGKQTPAESLLSGVAEDDGGQD